MGITKGRTLHLTWTVSSVSSGMVNSLKDVLGLSITLVSYDWIVSKMLYSI
jgi:hypothetical protein